MKFTRDTSRLESTLADIFKRRGIEHYFERFSFSRIAINGQELQLSVIEPPNPKGLILFTPGTNAYALLYGEYLLALADLGYKVVGYDPRCHGQSTGANGSYTIPELVDDLIALVHFFYKQGDLPIFLSGSSQGGIVSFYCAAKAEKLAPPARNARLLELANWESPGEGSFYDAIGNIAKMPHVQREQSLATDPIGAKAPYPTWWWLDDGLSRLRLSWQVTMDYPEAVVYAGVDPNATYKVRLTGYGQMLLRIDGERVQGNRAKIEHGDFVEFNVPAKALEDRRIELTWDRPTDEAHLNWRKQSRLAEAWLLKQ